MLACTRMKMVVDDDCVVLVVLEFEGERDDGVDGNESRGL